MVFVSITGSQPSLGHNTQANPFLGRERTLLVTTPPGQQALVDRMVMFGWHHEQSNLPQGHVLSAGCCPTPAVTNFALAKLERRALLQLVLLSQTGTTHMSKYRQHLMSIDARAVFTRLRLILFR